MRVKSSEMARWLANARSAGSLKFANTPLKTCFPLLMLSTNVFIYKPVPWFIQDMKGSLLRHAWLTG